ncbi:MAG: Rid family detoxifying hydrolase [Alicyclobacillus sp.]|nr:Rid family detoxifying hydrolase [Alicyclobacillus sp.]
MKKQEIRTHLAPTPVGLYSQGLRVGNRIYVAGQGPINVQTGKIAGETIESQTRQVLGNIRVILEAGGATLDDVVKCTVHLSDLKYFDEFNKVYKEFFHEPYPVRTTVGSQLKGMLVEIDVIAEVDG